MITVGKPVLLGSSEGYCSPVPGPAWETLFSASQANGLSGAFGKSMHVLFPPPSGYILLVSWLESKWAVLENVNSSFFFFPFFGRAALIPQPGIEPLSPAVEAWGLTYWTTGNSLNSSF